MLLHKVMTFVRNRSKHVDLVMYKIITYLAKHVTIAINLLTIKKPTTRPDPMIKRVLERFKSIKKKISARTEVGTPTD